MRHSLAPHHIAELQSILLDVDGGSVLADGGTLSIERLVAEADRTGVERPERLAVT